MTYALQTEASSLNEVAVMGVKNSKEYIERINRQRMKIWYQGKQVHGLLSEHPAFSGLLHTQSEMYDLQHLPETSEQMTYQESLSGDNFGLSFLAPRHRNDLVRRRKMMELWASHHHGFLGRSPDYMNTTLMSLYTAADMLAEYDKGHADNLRSYYEYCRSNDITLSHAFIQPLASRWSEQVDDVTDSIAAKVIDIQADGIVVSGAFMMATQAATCDEMLVFPSPLPSLLENDNPYAFAFAVPNDLEGITFICRDSCAGISSFDYPLSSRYEEMDAMVIFDHVFVPKDRIFYLGKEEIGYRLFSEGQFHTHTGHQVVTRYIAKTEFFLGLIARLADEQNAGLEPINMDRVARLLTILENLKALRLSAEILAEPDHYGYYVPAKRPLIAATLQFPAFHQEMLGMLQELSSSNLIMNPSASDLNSDAGSYIHTYLKGAGTTARDRIALFRLAWELGAGPFGGRQSQFEKFFFGNTRTISSRMFNSIQLSSYKKMIEDFLHITS
ncbi:4-hydroxyphenylacetate 3-hydroxylase N-terminal domain-containing protein [Paenibacillus sp. JX-17]|uniref:4-hydroxyphenylacetate 3-hydroxylase N-terminal domain-containing protein n=1 Tax=Paenibacillus lacisoli TaxID=3064525 RepID=A0ABT9CFH1_9BACL|nr:4-hydroxyphenylacetate 3-hydroxylase N-terminal domain-containing protein [Paenibacillus sp. JX-17]MDO7908002.1 4-hydroxyphenylacetate 3-hydroxylase N-terminal domain-containing protein [Paenibacillus sp. JX-17]